MYQAIKKYCENERRNGLYLMDMPTGFGKTYNVIKYIFDASTDESNKDRRYFFITTLKKNLPSPDLEQWFKRSGKTEEFKEKFLFIDSNVDCVISNLTEDLKEMIPSDIAKSDEYKEFVKNVEFLQKADNDVQLRSFALSILDNLRIKTEPAFRRLVQEMISKEYASVERRLLAVKTDKRWQWLGKLYPAVFTRDKQIIFMSVDKFLSRNTTIVEPSYTFYNSDIIDNAIIFIDEFDATKDTFLKNIIQNGLRDKVDFVELFGEIYSALQTNAFPAALTTPSKKRQGSDYANQSLQGVIDGIREKADTIYRDFSLEYSHRTTVEASASSKNFLFQDHQFHSVLDGNKSFITVQSDKKQKINAISFSQEKPEKEINNVQFLLGKLRGFISWFQGAVNILAINYMQRKLELRKEGDDEFSFESALRSVLSLFRLKEEHIDYLTVQTLMSSKKARGDIEGPEFDKSFYENGFRFYAFEDDSTHDLQSKIMMCSFQNTPEKTLLKICEKAKVIGISATATIETVVGNYDLEYIKVKMQNAFDLMSDSDRARLEDEFQSSQSGYNNVKIHRELIGEKDGNNYNVELWYSVYKSLDFAEKIYDRLEREQSIFKDNKNRNYNKLRYLRIALAYKRFISTPDIKSFLCVLTKHPKTGDAALNLATLFEIFKYIGIECSPGFNTRNSVVLLDGDEYDTKKNNAIQRLENGEKLFVISVYQTIGAGQNLQYKAPAAIRDSLVHINERDSEKKDFDAIYLDKPTNLLVNFTPGQAVEDEEFVKALFQYEYLQESAELSPDEARKHIKNAFRLYMSNGTAQREFAQNIHDSRSIRLLSTKMIIQAIGRICRTSLKNSNIYVFADSRIADCLDISVENRRMLNKEFVELLSLVKETGYRSPETKSLESEAVLKSARVNKDIRNMLEDEWNERRISKWQQLRELVLRKPTMSSEETEKNFVAWNYYIKLPVPNDHYFYFQSEDFNNIGISFKPDKEHPCAVSDEGANLNRMMSFDGIRRMFEANGYATKYVSNDYIMSPPLWNNVYKGALGEVVGSFLFEKVIGVYLEDITDPDCFELFDYKLGDLPVYVDFKNWHETTSFDWNKQIKKITDKASKCGCKCAIIANILTERDQYEVKSAICDGVEIVIVPSLLIDNPKQSLNNDAWKKIKECIDRYGNKDQQAQILD